MAERWDVAVVGGGPAGTAAAIALARSGRSVVVLERTSYDQARIGETLPPIARLPLGKLGAWEQFVNAGHTPSPGTLSAWGQAELDETSFVFSPYGHGWHLDRQRFDALLARLAADAGARLCQGARVTDCLANPRGGWQIEFTTGRIRETLQAAFLVDATGRASSLARPPAAKRISYDRLIGLVAFYSTPLPNQEFDTRTLVEAVADGWWYSARLPDSRLVAAFMTDADLKPIGRARLRRYWLDRLQQARHTRSRLRTARQATELSIVAAGTYRLDRVTCESWLAVGDAAMAFDPLSSLGIYTALESGLEAAQAIDNVQAGDPSALTAYDHWTDSSFDEYLRMRALHYEREQRWPASVFWQRRQPALEPAQ
jgi:flavin-dependent dehydrogenase